ncbi:hypothetical protein [Vibrio mediterranei]|uniref:hypothetical protein n=1 Tax=Vibrio mediterranei TaxID=689 RepID=UPI0022838416|nr:hypothetical protein [Vibrio mediterranei]MCY9856263.1 hypothetical protein [Vibrio mediterranei]
MGLVEELEKHQKSRGHNFGSLGDYEVWCDEVQPLLHFSEKHERNFENAKTAALVTYRIGSKEDAFNNINETIGIVNQAIILAKSMNQQSKPEVDSKQDSLSYPEKITLVWLAKHVEVKHWITLITLLVAVFGAGVKLGSSKLYLDNIKNIQPSINEVVASESDL